MRRGWCPSVIAPMPTGDGLLARVAPPMATLSPSAVRALAAAARAHGNGALGLTSGARIQVRGLTEASAPGFADAMARAGLAADDRLIVSPLAGDDPAVASDLQAVAREVAAGIGDVGPKFRVAVDGGGALPLDGVRADRRVHWDDGAWRTEPASDGAAPRSVGLIAYARTDRGAFGVAAPFGAIDADALDALADVAARYGSGALRVTPWRTLLVAGMRAAHAGVVARAAAAAGFIADPADPRLAVAACPGRPACANAEIDTRAAALELARAGLRGHVSGCAKGCAHPGVAAFTLVGRAGRYDVVRNGRASDPPSRSGLTLAEALA